MQLHLRFRQVLRLHDAGELHDSRLELRLQASLRKVPPFPSRPTRMHGPLELQLVLGAHRLRLHGCGSGVAVAGALGKAGRQRAAQAAAGRTDSFFASAA